MVVSFGNSLKNCILLIKPMDFTFCLHFFYIFLHFLYFFTFLTEGMGCPLGYPSCLAIGLAVSLCLSVCLSVCLSGLPLSHRTGFDHKNVLPVEAVSMVFKNHAPHSSPVHFLHGTAFQKCDFLVPHTREAQGGPWRSREVQGGPGRLREAP